MAGNKLTKERVYRVGCWWKTTKFYRLWKPVYARKELTNKQAQHPQWGQW